jgi:multiple sugar transport system substrate-binding protein
MRTRILLTLAFGLLGAAMAQTTITWWSPNFHSPRAEALLARFHELNPDIRVNLEVTVSDGLQNRILVALQSGTGPDLIDVANGWNVPFGLTGGLLALDDRIAASGLPLDDFLQPALGTATVDGQLYGLPFRVEAHALIYNRDMYREAGLDPDAPPQTWDELLDTAKALTRTNAAGQMQYGFGLAGGGEVGNMLFRSLPFIWMNGGDMLSADRTRAAINSPEAIEAVEFYVHMLTEDGVAPPSTLQNDGAALRRLFIAGAIAQYQSGQFDLPAIRNENPNIDVAAAMLPHPAGKETAAILGGWNWVIPAASRNPDAAWRLLEFLAQPENMGHYTDTFPARLSAMELPRFDDPDLEPYKAMLPFARPQPPVGAWVQIVQAYFDNVQRAMLGEVSVETAMNDLAVEIDRLLAR